MSYRLRSDDGEVVLAGDILIGRAADCQLRLHGGLVSRHHARARLFTGASSFHACEIVERNANELWCWGANDDDEIGVASTAKAILKPTRVALSAVTEVVATGGKDTCAVTQDGQLWCWGDNELGQLGIGKAGGVYRMPQAVSLCR